MAAVPLRVAQASHETGPTCLGMVLAAHGRRVGQEELRQVCGVGRDGTDLHVLAQAAESFGCTTALVDGGLDALDGAPLPAIAQWGAAHAVVIAGRHGRSWEVIDAISGRSTWSQDDLEQRLGGRVLLVEPGAGFEPSPRRGLDSPTSAASVSGNWPGLAFVVLAGLCLVLPGLLTPALVGLFVDRYLTAGSTQGATWIIALLTASLVLLVALTALQLLGLRRLMTALVTRNTAHFLWHLLRMPAWFYSQRDATTLAYRMGLNEKLADTLSSKFAAAVLAQATSLFFLVGMVVYSPLLAVISLLGLVLALLLTLRVARTRLEVRQVQAREAAVTATHLGVSMRMLETLKATGSEDIAFTRTFASIGRRLTLGNTHLWAYFAMVPVFAQAITAAVVLGVGALLVIRGSLTIGALAAFSMLMAGFLAPIAVLVPSIDAALNLRGPLDQLEDVMDQPVDLSMWDPYADGPPPARLAAVVEGAEEAQDAGATDRADDLDALLAAPATRRGRLSIDPWAATLELRDVAFSYNPLGAPQLSGISLRIPTGRIVAIVGASGSGKSTIGRLIAGLYLPTEGQILLDGADLLSHSRAQRARDIAFVDQDVVLYAASVRDNLTMFDPDIPDRDVIAAAKAALVHDDIVARPGGYDAVLAEEGRDRSGGQRQRLVIARALVRQPRLIVLDEATSALDARTESGVVESLRAFGCTTLMIAHRLSTVRDADEIIVMDHGRVAERGTHRELAAADGLYRRLMDA